MALRLWLLSGLLGLAACAWPVKKVVVVPVVIHIHDLDAWPETDTLCVAIPLQAVYIAHRCQSVGTIRSVILTMLSADAEESEGIPRLSDMPR